MATRTLLFAASLVAFCGCGKGKIEGPGDEVPDGGVDSDADTDMDADSDSDGDTDADSDSDSDTDTEVEVCVSDEDCDDGLFCNGVERCFEDLCIEGTAPECDDGIECTVDSCDEDEDACMAAPDDAACSDGLACNGAEVCSVDAGGCAPGDPVVCDDGIACTDDSCEEPDGDCSSIPNHGLCPRGDRCDPEEDCLDGEPCDLHADCDDGFFCNGVERCVDGGCVGADALDCDDGVSCTVDSCNEAADRCNHVTNDFACSDGLWCNGNEVCDAVLDCRPGDPPDCTDGVDCTVDACNEGLNRCAHTVEHARCDDGLACNGIETCNSLLGCRDGFPVECDDRVACTDDVCREPAGECALIPDHGACPDGERCDPDRGCLPGAPCVVAADCDDGLWCNGAERCVGGGCQAGVAPSCDDGVACTVDGCNELGDTCTHSPADALCDDGLWCNGAETCDVVDDCRPGIAPVCDDGIACTADTCNEADNRCQSSPVNARCDDGQWCNGAETCSAARGCVGGAVPDCGDGIACTVDACDEGADRCTHSANDALCDDDLACNGVERCDAARGCRIGVPMDCGDGVACTTDRCAEPGVCNSIPDDALCPDGQICDLVGGCEPAPICVRDADCDDGLWCNGSERCVGGDCVRGVAPSCSDGVGCTIDSCNEAADRCDHTPSNALCGDGLWCNGSETCDAVRDCQPGAPRDCSDGVACTNDFCDEGADRCTNTPIHARCDDGLWCNGAETCDAVRDCLPGVPRSCADAIACTVDLCDEGADRCTNTPNHGACDDRLACNGVETCNAALGCRPGIPVACGDGVSCTVDTCNDLDGSCTHRPDDGLCPVGEICDPVDDCGRDCDLDGDGFDDVGCGGRDCDDSDPNVHPGAADPFDPYPWGFETVDTAPDTTDYVNLAVDDFGDAHIGYTWWELGNPPDLKYATNASGAWQNELILSGRDAVGFGVFDCDLDVDSAGNAHMTWIENAVLNNSPWMYGTNESGDWVFTELIGPGVDPRGPAYENGVWNSIAIDSDDTAHIVGFTEAVFVVVNDVDYWTNAGGGWVKQDVSADSVTSQGSLAKPAQLAMALDSADSVHVCFSIDGTNDLRYASNATGRWVIENVDTAGSTGRDCSIAVDDFDVVHISYYDFDDFDLRYARGNSGAWNLTTVDSVGRVGSATGIAVDGSGYVHMSYVADGEVTHATNARGGWSFDVLEVGDQTSIGVDADSGVHLAYHQDGSLEYAYQQGGDAIDQDCDGADM